MKHNYYLEYLNENDFRIKERNLKKYNMLAYKKLYFEYYPNFKNGKFLGEKVGIDKIGGIKYELDLPTDELFKKVYGQIVVHYTVYEDKNMLLLTDITPSEILEGGHTAEIPAYKGVMVSKKNEDSQFKINLLNMLKK